nr:hypothetical protein [uncultured Chryseobacterium sp.]
MAQKTRTDTVFVYEKVIVYDTVYMEKAIKSRINGVQISPSVVKDQPTENRIFKIKEKTISEKSFSKSIQYGFEGGIGLKKSSWAKGFGKNKQQFGENLGIWVSKSAGSNLYLMLSANIYHWNSIFDLDATKEDTYLNGFYFTRDSQPLLFQRFNNKHFEYSAQLKVLYEWRKLRPFVGFAVNRNRYKMQFLVPEKNVLNKLDDFESKQFNVGFSFGLQYRILPKILITADYQQFSMNNLSLKNSSFDFDIFKTDDTFSERKFNVGISYVVSK